VPHPAYQFFIDKFVDAIRIEVARSAERAYESLAIKDMAGLFMIKNQDELNLFITQNSMKDGVEWQVANGRVYFKVEKKDQKEIPSSKMINLSLEYATVLNRII
jgi:hypothetical protein